MPDYQRKTIPFLHRGMNWNNPVDKLQDGQVPWAKNIRVKEQGTVTSADGHTVASGLDGQPFPNTGYVYQHSISRLNINNPAYDTNLKETWVMGADTELHIFQNAQTLIPQFGFNPVWTPTGQFQVFSGNPLSIVDMQPVGGGASWKYIGDSKQMVTAGYYPTDTQGGTMGRALSMGLRPPVQNNVVQVNNDGGAPGLQGNLNGDYQWVYAYRRTGTGAKSNPSAPTRFNILHPATTVTNGSVTLTLPNAPPDPQPPFQPDSHVVIDIFRFGGNLARWALVGSAPGGSQFTDNASDLSLLAAPSPPQATDPVTGLTRFNLFQPFVTQDVAHAGVVEAFPQPNGAWIITPQPPVQPGQPTPFNLNWLPGSTIIVNGIRFSIFQVISPTVIELSEDPQQQLQPGGFGLYTWSIPAGTLMSGQPLPHLWGPYGLGVSASYLFACGDANAPGTLYWTNGNDPDSTDVVNNIVVTNASEKLQAGCVYDGQPFVWSTERQFQIFPSLTVFGQFTTQEVAGAKGLWLEFSLSVQSNGITDQSVTWRGKDGLYDWSASGLRRLTDDLYPFFPHDGEFGIAPETIMPFINARSEQPENVGNLDDSQPKYHRTCWFMGMLFYDFVARTDAGNTFSTLVWDDIQVKGWVSLDQPFQDTVHPVARGIDISNNVIRKVPDPQLPDILDGLAKLKVTQGGWIYDYFGFTRGFESRIITRAEDMGDPRANKLFGDYWLDCTPLVQLVIAPKVNFHASTLTHDFVGPLNTRNDFILDFDETVTTNGLGVMQQTLGLDIHWNPPDGQFAPVLNQWSPSFVMKPEFIAFRFTDKTDEGLLQAKYLMGMNMEANTDNTAFQLNILVDGNLVAQPIVQHNGQSEKPYGWEPIAGYEFQVQMNFPQNVQWQLYKIKWIFEPWPDTVARKYPFNSLGDTGSKFIQGVVLPMETGGQQTTVGLWGDDDNITRSWTKSTLPLKKTGVVLNI